MESKEMTTEEKINKIHKEQFNYFKGKKMFMLHITYELLRREIGDEKYLEFIQDLQQKFPRPVYQYPKTI